VDGSRSWTPSKFTSWKRGIISGYQPHIYLREPKAGRAATSEKPVPGGGINTLDVSIDNARDTWIAS